MGYKQHGPVWPGSQQWLHHHTLQGQRSGGGAGTADISWHISQHCVDCCAPRQVCFSYAYMCVCVYAYVCLCVHVCVLDIGERRLLFVRPHSPFSPPPFHPPTSHTPSHILRRASAMWHWPYCVSVSEKTFECLLSLLTKYRNIGGEQPTPPFLSKE